MLLVNQTKSAAKILAVVTLPLLIGSLIAKSTLVMLDLKLSLDFIVIKSVVIKIRFPSTSKLELQREPGFKQQTAISSTLEELGVIQPIEDMVAGTPAGVTANNKGPELISQHQ